MSESRLQAIDDNRFAVQGDLTFQTVPALHRAGGDRLATGGEVSLDLAEVARTDSAGVALLVDWLREARRAGGDLRLLHMPEQMRSIVRVSGLERLLPLSEDA